MAKRIVGNAKRISNSRMKTLSNAASDEARQHADRQSEGDRQEHRRERNTEAVTAAQDHPTEEIAPLNVCPKRMLPTRRGEHRPHILICAIGSDEGRKDCDRNQRNNDNQARQCRWIALEGASKSVLRSGRFDASLFLSPMLACEDTADVASAYLPSRLSVATLFKLHPWINRRHQQVRQKHRCGDGEGQE